MTMLAVQSFLLILAAFFAGAMIACFVRRVFFSRDGEKPTPDDGRKVERSPPEPETTTSTTTKTVTTEETKRFGRALTGTDPVAAAAVAAPTVAATDAQSSVSKQPSPCDEQSAASVSSTQGTDDLTLINSISSEIAQRLNAAGVKSFAEIADWNAGDVARVNQTLGFVGRIEKQNWIEQAQILGNGGRTKYADKKNGSEAETKAVAPMTAGEPEQSAAVPSEPTPSAPVAPSTPTSDVALLRSVRSEALVGTESSAGDNVVTLPTAVATHRESDDLKRIRGIGVLIEKRLNAMGVLTYAQVANWTAADVARVSQTLDFKGRIERESWIEQARILSSGGHTEFSRRSS